MKIDSKIRFHHQGFKKRLQEARYYKRSARTLPEGKWGSFLFKIGLGSWPAKFLATCLALFTIYLIYIPNFLFVKTLRIENVEGEYKVEAEKTLNAYFNKNFFWPQKNLLLLSKVSLKNYLEKNSAKISAVKTIQKDFPSTLILNLEPRVDQYLLTAEDTRYQYIISNDGLVVASLLEAQSTSSLNKLLKISVKRMEEPANGQRILDDRLISAISLISQNLQTQTNLELDSFELFGLTEPDLTVNTKNGFKILFDVKLDAKEILERLRLLLGQISEADKQRLYYLDMRIVNRGYVCYKNTACALASPIASSTPSQELRIDD